MLRLLTALLLLTALAGCAPQTDATAAAPTAVLNYLQALVDKDRDRFVGLFCAAFEAEAMTEFDSFGAVEAELDGVDCEPVGTQDGFTQVKCSGSIAVTYEGEDNKLLSLEDTIYRVTQEGGEWKMCGYE